LNRIKFLPGSSWPRLLLLAAAVLLGSGCATPLLAPTPTAVPSPTPDLPPADEAAYLFLQAWEQDDYATMYGLISPDASDVYSLEVFTAMYRSVAAEADLYGITPRILSAYQPGYQAEVTFQVAFQSASVGTFEVENRMHLAYEQGAWEVGWSPALILPQLSDETFVHLTPRVPSRGNIYDRNGRGLAVQGELVEVGIVPGDIQDEDVLLAHLSALLGQPAASLRERYAASQPDWYVPLGRIPVAAAQASYELLSATPGIELHEAWTRSYRPEIIAPHIVGIVGPIPEEGADLWRAEGYSGDELVGQLGLEKWGEPYLSGERGGRLEILSVEGDRVAVLADRPAREANSLYTTFDREFQKKVQDILGNRLGAIAVLEAQTGRVLALATYPQFDPNLFSTGIGAAEWQALQADLRRPLVNRATQGTYPAGSVFKIVTTAAGMEAGGLAASSSFICRGTWTGLGPEWPKTCWAKSGHGNISLDRALTVSCDITYYQVGLLLNGVGQDLLPTYARRFGFGTRTGIEIAEEAGLVPDPAWKLATKGEGWAPGDSVNLAIGQAELQVTPLQVAVMVAAVGNGGTLYRPQIVEMVAADVDAPEWVFEPVAAGTLGIKASDLEVIQQSLYRVTSAAEGTAYQAFEGLVMPVAGKTGTAESGQPLPHAWFAGYAPAGEPEIAIAVIVENAGEGAAYAAPLFRQVLEAYFGIEPEPDAAETPQVTPSPTPGP
jgi:penicillin-binding protein 2